MNVKLKPSRYTRGMSNGLWRLLPMALLALVLPWSVALAWQPSPDDVFEQMAGQADLIERAIIETHTTVYQTEAQGAEKFPALPVPLPNLSYRQTIYYQQGDFLAVETNTLEGKPLHFYYRDDKREVSVSVATTRPMALMDVLHPALPWLENNMADLRAGLSFWGVLPNSIELVRSGKGRLHYRLSDSGSGEFWVDNETMTPIRLVSHVFGAQPPLRMEIEFADILKVGFYRDHNVNVSFPRTVNLLVEGVLLKQTETNLFHINPAPSKFPANALKDKAKQLEKRG